MYRAKSDAPALLHHPLGGLMRLIQCPEKDDPAELSDGTMGTITAIGDAVLFLPDLTWEVAINIGNEVDGDQILAERIVKWATDRWREIP